MKKIAIIFPKDSEAFFNRSSKETFGGANVQMYLIAKELGNHKDVKTFSFILDYPTIDFDQSDTFNLVKTFRKNDGFFVRIFKFTKQLYSVHPDVVIQHGLTIFSCVLAIVCRMSGTKFVFMFAHDNEVEGRYQVSGNACHLFGLLLGNAALLITQSVFQKQELLRRFNRKSVILKNGFELNDNQKKTDGTILWVARHDNQKQPEIFLELASAFPKYRFVMISPKVPSDTEVGYLAFTQRARGIVNLQFIEYVPFSLIDDYFKKAKVFVSTSSIEGYPQVFIQAALNAVPILSLRVDPDGFIASHGAGLVCEDRFELLTAGIEKLMENEDVYESCSENIYQYALNNHDIKKNVQTLLSLINDVGILSL